MNKCDFLKAADVLLSEVRTAVLATVSSDNEPRMRWMSPVFLKGHDDCLYCVTSPSFNKTGDLKSNKTVQWMIQSKTLDRIITLNGKIDIVENISLRAEVIEKLGTALTPFWTVNENTSDIVVLETEVSSGVIFYPSKGRKEYASFGGGTEC
jgi:general stress protein 26